VPSTLALGTYELSEDGIFLKYPVVFPKHLTVQVQKLLPVNSIQEAKSFEPLSLRYAVVASSRSNASGYVY
jgi:hypothetical protein